MKKNRTQSAKSGAPRLPVTVWLAYLLVCTLLFTGVSFSRYTVTNSGDDTARVAAGLVTVEEKGPTELEMVRPEDDSEQVFVPFPFDVSNNNSEVAIQYDLVITLDEPLPEGVMVMISRDGESPSLIFGNADDTTCAISDAGTFAAGSPDKHSYILMFTGNFEPINDNYTRTISISVQAEQID